ncbi:ROK family protein [Paracoccus sp. (in: a-proteobacteria)]|uniref:ROK family protein n=1 Tax=Paracoccus sp. TaxID=267 RepID=UPI003A87C004
MATPRTIRQINRHRAIRLLMREGRASRAGVARDLEMMRSSAGSLVEELLSEGALRPIDAEGGGQGRPAQYFELNPAYARFVGIEVGIRRIHLVARDFRGRLCHSQALSMQGIGGSPAGVCAAVAGLVRQTADVLDWPQDGRLSLGLTFPGTVSHDGTIMRAPLLGWRDVSMMPELHAAFPDLQEIFCDNDANAFAIAELEEGAIQNLSDAAALWLDVGIGGAFVNEGRLVRGHHGLAGEFGHILSIDRMLEGKSPLRIEALIGREAIFAELSRISGDRLTLPDVVARLSDDANPDPALRCVIDQWQMRCAAVIASLVSALDPGVILLGGPLAQLFLGDVTRLARMAGDLMLPGTPPPRIVLARTGASAAATGVAIMLRDRRLDAELAVRLD